MNAWKQKNKRVRKYAHFDTQISLLQVWDYISDVNKIKTHGFYPFITYTQKFNKYSKTGSVKPKVRKICYSAHIDRCIYQLYGFKLNEYYNNHVKNNNLSHSVIAYRNNLGKCNIDFAFEVFNNIFERENCFVLVGDFTSFFDNLNHAYLKKQLCNLLGVKMLPDDYYAVYKNITKHSTWDLEHLLLLNELPNNKQGRYLLNKQEKVLNAKLFKDNKRNIKKNSNDFGIPQGSAISAVLSNIYMLDFDNDIGKYVAQHNGLYRRYSDDFILVFPNVTESKFKHEILPFMFGTVKNTPNLELHKDKTMVYYYDNNKLENFNNRILGTESMKDSLDYLGFTFNGNTLTVREKTLTKYHYRMNRQIKNYKKFYTSDSDYQNINKKNIYKKYSIKGAFKGKGNFITYIERSKKTATEVFNSPHDLGQGTNRHMKKIKDRLGEPIKKE